MCVLPVVFLGSGHQLGWCSWSLGSDLGCRLRFLALEEGVALGMPGLPRLWTLRNASLEVLILTFIFLLLTWSKSFDRGIPQGCPLSMMLKVALYLRWCRYLGELPDVSPQLYADNLKCVSSRPEQLLRAAQFPSAYVRLVGQEPASSMCILMSTSAAVRREMRAQMISDKGSTGRLS